MNERHDASCSLGAQLDAAQPRHSLVQVWKRTWEERLEQSRLIWGSHGEAQQAFRAPEASIAHDPWEAWNNSRKDLGFLFYLKTALPNEVERLCVPRRLASGLRGRTLFHELVYVLIDEPNHKDLVVVPNRWPRVPFQAMLISSNWQPQRLTHEFVSAQLDWAARGAVAEFHRRAMPVDHLHGHLLLPEFVPLTRYTSGFREDSACKGLSLGFLQDHLLSQVALSSEEQATLAKAILAFSDLLESTGQWFYEVVVRDPSTNRLIALFTLWKKRPTTSHEPIFQRARIDGVDLSLGFNASGVLRSSPHVELDVDTIVERLTQDYLMNDEEVRQMRARFWDSWTETGHSKTLVEAKRDASVIDEVRAAFQASNPAWDHSGFSSLKEDSQRDVFRLYVERYGGRWMKFPAAEKGFEDFRAFYQEAFLLRNGERLTAFVLARNKGCNLVLNLMAAEAGYGRELMSTLPTVFQVAGVYGLVSGRVMDYLIRTDLRPNDVLKVRKEGRFAFSVLPVVNPRLAALLLDGAGDTTVPATPEADGVYCRFTPVSASSVSMKALLLGSPLVKTQLAHRHGVQVVLEDSFLISERYRQLTRVPEKHPTKPHLVHQELAELVRNGHLFSNHPLETKLRRPEINSLLHEPGFLNDLLEIWRIKIWRLKILTVLLQLANRDSQLERPSTTELNQASNSLNEFEAALELIVGLKEDSVAQKVRELARQTRDEWSRRCRVVVTDAFGNDSQVVARGMDGICAFLNQRIQHDATVSSVGIGGPSGAGKSTFAGALADFLRLDGRRAEVIATDGFLTDTFLAGDIRALEAQLRTGIFEDTVWDIKAYCAFLKKIRSLGRAKCLPATLAIDNFYDRDLKKRVRKEILVAEKTVFILEGWIVLPRNVDQAFELTVFLDVSDDLTLRDRMVAREPEKEDVLLQRFAALDRPFGALLALRGDHKKYTYVMDQTDLESPVLYAPLGARGAAH